MIHAQSRVIAPAGLSVKHRVGGQRTAHVDPRGAQLGDGRFDDLNLFASETAAFSRMRVEPGDGEGRSSDAKILPQRRLGDAAGMNYRGGGKILDCLLQCEMDGYGNDPQPGA